MGASAPVTSLLVRRRITRAFAKGNHLMVQFVHGMCNQDWKAQKALSLLLNPMGWQQQHLLECALQKMEERGFRSPSKAKGETKCFELPANLSWKQRQSLSLQWPHTLNAKQLRRKLRRLQLA